MCAATTLAFALHHTETSGKYNQNWPDDADQMLAENFKGSQKKGQTKQNNQKALHHMTRTTTTTVFSIFHKIPL